MRQFVTVLALLSMSVLFTACLGGEDAVEETAPAAEEVTVEPVVPAVEEPAVSEPATEDAAATDAAATDAAETSGEAAAEGEAEPTE